MAGHVPTPKNCYTILQPIKRTNALPPIYPDVTRSMKRQITFEVPLALHIALIAKAKEMGMSVNYMILSELQPYLKQVESEAE